jgi:ubiquinone/menaquinone biosynthesis C-methylase UbiE
MCPAAFPSLRFIGIDWSEDMLAHAKKRAESHPGLMERMSFRQGDMRRVHDALKGEKIEVRDANWYPIP